MRRRRRAVKPTAHRRAQRSYRAKDGAIVVRVEVTNEIIGLLIDLGWSPVDASEDRSAIAQAIHAVLENVSR